MSTLATQLLRAHPIISEQVSHKDVQLVLDELLTAIQAGVPGDVVELGCYIGTTSLFIRRLLDAVGPTGQGRAFHVYDSFAGLPAKSAPDHSAAGVDFTAGGLSVSKKQFLHAFQRAGLRPPVVHKAWFSNLATSDVPEHIAFAFLDGDFYQSILDSLRLVWPRMSPGGAVLIDDYQREALPGVEQAVHDFFGAGLPAVRVAHNIAVIKKPS